MSVFAAPPCDRTLKPDADLANLPHPAAQKIMLKRQREAERLAIIQDERRRNNGVEHHILREQVEDKQARTAEERVEAAQFADTLAVQDYLLQTIDGIKNADRNAREKATKEFSQIHCRKEDRREYDLCDPKAYVANYTTLPDEELGPSAMAKFQGQAPDVEKVAKIKQETADNLKMQMDEKRQREDDDRQYHLDMDAKLDFANGLRMYCEEAQLQEAHDDKVLETQENQQLAAEHLARRLAKTEREREEEAGHVEYLRNSEFLTESFDYKVGSNGKTQRTDYKRLSVEEEQTVFNANCGIIKDNRERKRLEKQELEDNVQNMSQACAILQAAENLVRQQKQDRVMAMVEANKAAAAAKKKADEGERAAYLSYERRQ